MNNELEEILTRIENSVEAKTIARMGGKLTSNRREHYIFKKSMATLIANQRHQAITEFAAELKLRIKADYEEMAHAVMQPAQFKWNENTYGYRTIDALLEETTK